MIADGRGRTRWWGDPIGETRSVLEAARLLVDPVAYGRGVPAGDARHVIVVPGFLAGDESLVLMSAWLRLIGYRPRGAGFRFNVDCAERAAERVELAVEAAAEAGARRVAIVGHSRGGHLARAVAARRPELVSHAISMGADLQNLFGISAPTLTAVGLARRGAHLTGRSRSADCFRSRCSCTFIRDYSAPFPVDRVRLTSIFTKGDGVVRWERAIVDEAECVEVTGSHVGMVANRKVYRAIAESLAVPELADADDD